MQLHLHDVHKTCTRGRSAVFRHASAWGQSESRTQKVRPSSPSAYSDLVRDTQSTDTIRVHAKNDRADQGSTSPARSDLPDKKKTSTVVSSSRKIVWQLTEALLGRGDVNLWNRLEQMFGLPCARKSHRGEDAQRSVRLPDH